MITDPYLLLGLIRNTREQMADLAQTLVEELLRGDPEKVKQKALIEYGTLMIGLLDFQEKLDEFKETGAYELDDFGFFAEEA